MCAPSTRREFPRQSAIAAAGMIIAPAGAARTYAANEKVNVAAVGVGGMGAGHTKHLAGLGANIAGICDVGRDHWFVRDQRRKLCDDGRLVDTTDCPLKEKELPAGAESDVRQKFQKVMDDPGVARAMKEHPEWSAFG